MLDEVGEAGPDTSRGYAQPRALLFIDVWQDVWLPLAQSLRLDRTELRGPGRPEPGPRKDQRDHRENDEGRNDPGERSGDIGSHGVFDRPPVPPLAQKTSPVPNVVDVWVAT